MVGVPYRRQISDAAKLCVCLTHFLGVFDSISYHSNQYLASGAFLYLPSFLRRMYGQRGRVAGGGQQRAFHPSKINGKLYKEVYYRELYINSSLNIHTILAFFKHKLENSLTNLTIELELAILLRL